MATPVHFHPFINFELYKPVEAELQSELEMVQTLSQNNEWYRKWGERFVCIAYPTGIIFLIATAAFPAILLNIPVYTGGFMIGCLGIAPIIQTCLQDRSRNLQFKKINYIFDAAVKMMEPILDFENSLSTNEAKERCLKIKMITDKAFEAFKPFLPDNATVKILTRWNNNQDTLVDSLKEETIQATLDETKKAHAKIGTNNMAISNYMNMLIMAQVGYNTILQNIKKSDSL